MGGSGSAPLEAVLGAGLVTTVATVFAVRADSLRPLASGWMTAFDVGVGLAFVLAAWLASGPAAERWLMAGVGIAWLVGSSVPVVGSVHQTVLLIALVAFPGGRLRRWPERGVAALAVPVSVGVVTQAGIAALFFGTAVYVVFDRSRTTIGRTYPALACGSVAAALGTAWAVGLFLPGRADPTSSLVSYEVVLAAVAVAFPLASRAVIRSRMLLADEALRAGEPAGLAGLTAVLRDTLRDGQLGIHLWDGVAGCYIDAAGQPLTEAAPSRRWLGVVANGEPVAVVESRSIALDDPATAEGVASAVRLMVRNIQLQAHQRAQLAELDASRLRLLAATDRVREQVAADLTTSVQRPLAAALSSIERAQRSTPESEAAAALSIARAELRGVRDDLAALVAGVPAFDLGAGMLQQALDTLALASPVPVDVRVSADAAVDREAETTLFYFCCEAVTNAVKHAAGTRIRIEVHRTATDITAVVSDDGKGGAEPTTAGSGLRGLQDRLASVRGRLQVESSPGAGTRLTATIPLDEVRRFSAMASR
jgi:signal transduction histidine kinase